MARVSTQAAKRKVVPLRSRFVALPLDKSDFVFARTHLDPDSTTPSSENLRLFVTGLPLGTSSASLKSTFAPFGTVSAVELILPLPSGPTSLLTQSLASASSTTTTPLFLSSPPPPSPLSAILTFTSPPLFPPSTKSIPPLTRPTSSLPPSFLSASKAKYALARPHLSTIISHSDSWMSAYDLRQQALAPAAYAPSTSKAQKAAAKAKGGRNGKNGGKGGNDVGPLPGSAAAALAAHSAAVRAAADRTTNPDEVQEGEWTLVSRGGKHGQSLLPTGATPGLLGYGAVTVGVARKGGKRRAGADEEKEDGEGEVGEVKKIVGDGFYRFTREDGRKKDLENLKARFEEDKARVGRFREGRGRGGSSHGGGGRGRGASRGRGGASSGGRDARSYKPY